MCYHRKYFSEGIKKKDTSQYYFQACYRAWIEKKSRKRVDQYNIYS